MTITMYDAIPEEFGNIPADPPAVAAYVDGFGGYSQLASRFPHAHRLSITIHGNTARCADVEAGAMGLDQLPGWYHTKADHSQGKPWIYGSASTVPAIINTMQLAGISRSSYFIWSAHWAGRHICGPHTCGFPQADGTQYDDHVNGRSCDISVLSDDMFLAPPPPRPQGIAKALVSYDLGKFHWRVEHQPGSAQFGADSRWASAEIQFNVHTGEWRIKRIHWNSAPLGGH